MMKWSKIFSRLEAQFAVEKLPPVSTDALAAVAAALKLPVELVDLYEFTNGVSYEWFRILPIYVVEAPKRTWDSLQKANDTATSKFQVDDAFLARFLVFAEIGVRECAVFDRSDGTIWFEDEDGLNRTDLDLEGFVEVCLRDVDA